ncbi:CRISPR-associated helicase/endonuclease Cas3 [filamentous cyanobacterium CCP3]|nr:CRISPR-associated helicase/endonuclease Cas3 [filamentous cyanobacterium CCP3]
MKPSFAAHTPPKGADERWHGLKEHLSDVAQVARRLADKFGAADLGSYAGLWHDLGKYNPAFQDYLQQCQAASESGEAEPKGRVPHAIYGAKLALEQFPPLAPLIFGHHAGLPQQTQMMNRLAQMDLAVYQAILQEAQAEKIDLAVPQAASEQISALAQDPFSFDLLLRMLFSCLVDADYLDTEDHFSPDIAASRGARTTVTQLWRTLQAAQQTLTSKVDATPVNLVRAEVYQACQDAVALEPGVFRLAVPTGGGKTRSGLAFALAHAVHHDLDRVIVAVPYTSIIEQTVEVYRGIFGQEAVLEHHSAIRPEQGNEEDARARQAQARLATQNWDAPLIVTTTVQLFESLLANRTSRCRKLHNIVSSVVILDEVQTLPAGLLEPILSVLKGLCRQYRVSLVLCTATQPALEGETPYLKGFTAGTVRDIVPKAMAKQHFANLSRVAYSVPASEWSWADVANDVSQHEQALVILNIRKDALAVLSELADEEKDDHLFHLSTLLCGQHRREVLQEVRERLGDDRPCMLVSTQVVEAGVDLDFPVVYRAVGPLDRIVQAAGRCNREGRRPAKGQVTIFRPQEVNLPPGEYRKAFDETTILLQRPNLDWDDPGMFDDYFRRLYQGLSLDAKEVQKYREGLDFPEVAARFQLIPDDTTPVMIEYDDRASEHIHRIRRYGLRSGDMKALQPYLVNLRSREFKETEDLRDPIAPGVWLWQGGYDPKKGIAIGNTAIVRDPADLIL